MPSNLESKLEYIYVVKIIIYYLFKIQTSSYAISCKLVVFPNRALSKAFLLLMKKSIIDTIDFLFNNGNVLLFCFK